MERAGVLSAWRKRQKKLSPPEFLPHRREAFAGENLISYLLLCERGPFALRQRQCEIFISYTLCGSGGIHVSRSSRRPHKSCMRMNKMTHGGAMNVPAESASLLLHRACGWLFIFHPAAGAFFIPIYGTWLHLFRSSSHTQIIQTSRCNILLFHKQLCTSTNIR
jgi:hypothetical protein